MSPSDDAPKAAKVNGIGEWFWRHNALAKTRELLPPPSPRAAALASRARQCAEFGNDMLTPVEATEASAEATICGFYWQASYWALSALSPGVEEQSDYRVATWDAVDDPLLELSADDASRRETLRAALYAGSFVFFAELLPAEQAKLRVELQKLTTLLLDKLDGRSRAVHFIYFQRVWRLGLILLAVLVVAGILHWRHEASDLAVGRPWTTSSSEGNAGCTSPAQECKESPGFFFHTNEEKNPWIEFDLGETRDISSVDIDNRIDCCTDRVFPLTVDVSTNHKNWKTVARQDQEFTNWRPSFHTAQARWVRLRVHKQTYLHLSHVRIFP